MARAIWKGAISFGLVTIPVGLYSAIETGEGLTFRLLHEKDHSPIDYKRVCEKEGVEVPWSDIVKGYEYQKGHFVVLSDEDFEKARVPASDTFDIDNAPPMITINSVSREAGRTIVRFVVKDADFPVQRVEYSLDADRWRPLYPRDGIADSRTEEFELTLDQDVSEKAIILRAFDGMNNVATARAEAPVPTTTGPTR